MQTWSHQMNQWRPLVKLGWLVKLSFLNLNRETHTTEISCCYLRAAYCHLLIEIRYHYHLYLRYACNEMRMKREICCNNLIGVHCVLPCTVVTSHDSSHYLKNWKWLKLIWNEVHFPYWDNTVTPKWLGPESLKLQRVDDLSH